MIKYNAEMAMSYAASVDTAQGDDVRLLAVVITDSFVFFLQLVQNSDYASTGE